MDEKKDIDPLSRAITIRGRPIDNDAADFLGSRGVRIADIIDRITPKRKIKGIVAWKPDTEADIQYE